VGRSTANSTTVDRPQDGCTHKYLFTKIYTWATCLSACACSFSHCFCLASSHVVRARGCSPLRYLGEIYSRTVISNIVSVTRYSRLHFARKRFTSWRTFSVYPALFFPRLRFVKSCYWYMCVMRYVHYFSFFFYFSNLTRTSTYFSRLTLGNVNNMYWYSRICYCFSCLHINYSNLNYFPRDLSTKKSRVLRTQTLDYSFYSTSLDPGCWSCCSRISPPKTL